jgi:hypothetical protein
VEGAERQSAVELGSRPNFRTESRWLPKPVPPQMQSRNQSSKKQRFTLYFNKIWRRGSQSIPIEKIMHFRPSQAKTHHLSYGPKWDFAA